MNYDDILTRSADISNIRIFTFCQRIWENLPKISQNAKKKNWFIPIMTSYQGNTEFTKVHSRFQVTQALFTYIDSVTKLMHDDV